MKTTTPIFPRAKPQSREDLIARVRGKLCAFAPLRGILVALLALTFTALAGEITTPKIGSPERKAIMDALRTPVEKKLKKKVIFRVGTLRVADGWAFLQGNALRPDGTELGDEDLWGELTAVLRKQDGKWTVAHWGLATDTGVMDEAKKKFPAMPKGLMPGI
jgi:hypothetical protein